MFSPRNMIGDASARRLLILIGLVLVCAFTGGSFRSNLPMLLLLRPVLAIGLVALAVLPATYAWHGLRWPALLLLAFATSMVLQLVPLPVAWWLELAGRARYAPAVQASGVSTLPLSLVPDLTINSLFGLLPAACVLLAYAGMREQHRFATLWLAIGLGSLSVVLALMQLGGPGGFGYLYGGRQDFVGGILANRNHQAVLLGSMLPLLAVAARYVLHRHWPGIATAALAGAGVMIVPMILLTGSRQGLILALFATVTAVLIAPRPGRRVLGRFAGSGRWIAIGLMVVAAGLIALAVFSGRAVSIDRLLAANAVSDDARWRNLPTVLELLRTTLPWGIGYGTFDPVYRGVEPDQLLHGSYFNHVHNDLIETMLTGGVAGAALIILLMVALAWRMVHMVRQRQSQGSLLLDRAGLVVVAMILAASLVDYPLRTGILSMVFALAMCWVFAPPVLPSARQSRSGRTGPDGGFEQEAEAA